MISAAREPGNHCWCIHCRRASLPGICYPTAGARCAQPTSALHDFIVTRCKDENYLFKHHKLGHALVWSPDVVIGFWAYVLHPRKPLLQTSDHP